MSVIAPRWTGQVNRWPRTAQRHPALALHVNDDNEATMFRLIATVKRGVSSDLDEVLTPYHTLDDARQAAQSLSRCDVVATVMITRDDVLARIARWTQSPAVSRQTGTAADDEICG